MRSIVVAFFLTAVSFPALAGRCGTVDSVIPGSDVLVFFNTLGIEKKRGNAKLRNTPTNLILATQAVGNPRVELCLTDSETEILMVRTTFE